MEFHLLEEIMFNSDLALSDFKVHILDILFIRFVYLKLFSAISFSLSPV